MAYIKFKELSKYFDFNHEVVEADLPDYAKEYVEDNYTYIKDTKTKDKIYSN